MRGMHKMANNQKQDKNFFLGVKFYEAVKQKITDNIHT
jgi:hypothetical protein